MKRLSLLQQRGALVAPLVFKPEERRDLARYGLTTEHIDRLQVVAEHARHLREVDAGERSLTQEKEILKAASDHAARLAQILKNLPTRAEGVLAAVGHAHLGGVDRPRELAEDLDKLVTGIDAALKRLPRQEYARTNPDLVAAVAAVTTGTGTGIRPSRSAESRFHKVCTIVFWAIGAEDPTGSIKAFLNRKTG